MTAFVQGRSPARGPCTHRELCLYRRARLHLALTLAAGSAFTNGFARLLPGPYHLPPIFLLPQSLPLGLLVFRMIRVRFTGWRQS